MGQVKRGFGVVCLAALLMGVVGLPASADVPPATITGPVGDDGIQGHPLFDSGFDLTEFGYEEHEYFVGGTATDADGNSAAYTTRMIVTRPASAADYAGTVMLDWTNVTAQFENPVDSITALPFLLRNGWAFVHVSAQAAGVCCSPLTPTVWDPARYAALNHPGDQFASDMFSQLAQTFRTPGDVDPMGGLVTEVIIAAGQSQSANQLTNYVTTTQADAGVIDAFLIQAEGSKIYDAAPAAPVIHLLGEREATPEEPTVWPTYRLWEVAGSAHQDLWIGRQQIEGQAPRTAGAPKQPRSALEALWQSAGNYGEQIDPRTTVCIVNGAAFPTRYVVDAALFNLDRWVRTGTPPPDGDRFEFDGTGQQARDDLGNALGGIRLPPIEVPIARYMAATCNLGGITIPLTEAEILQRYPDHDTYYAAMVEAARASHAEGFLLPADAVDLLTRACAAANRFVETVDACDPAPEAALAAGPATPTPAPASPGQTPAPAPSSSPPAAPAPSPSTTASPATAPTQPGGGSLPATGGGAALLALLAATAATSRRRRPDQP